MSSLAQFEIAAGKMTSGIFGLTEIMMAHSGKQYFNSVTIIAYYIQILLILPSRNTTCVCKTPVVLNMLQAYYHIQYVHTVDEDWSLSEFPQNCCGKDMTYVNYVILQIVDLHYL